MLTPRFELIQSDSDITITIYAPYANVAETEIFAAEEHFRFFSPPYYLRLHLPGSIEETEASTGRYDCDSGKFTVCVAKVKKGEYFPDLDLLTTLLAPRKPKDIVKPGIEVIGPTSDPDIDDPVKDGSEWLIEQTLEVEKDSLTKSTITYGFGNQCSGVFSNFKDEIHEILDLLSPDTTPLHDRIGLQIERENTNFGDEHYLADFMEADEVKHLLKFDPAYSDILTTNHTDIMKDLPNREYLLSKTERCQVYYGLVDILFAFCYNHRTTEGENNAESAWAINKLSATFSWLQSFPSLEAALKSAFRRSLIYPLYRNYELSVKVLDDVQTILNSGKKQVLKCLLEILTLFNSSEPRYLLNQLYVRDYCVWIQQSTPRRLETLSVALVSAMPSKSELDLDLEELEAAGKSVQEEEDSIAMNQLENLKLDSDSDTYDSDSDSSDSSTIDSDDLTDRE